MGLQLLPARFSLTELQEVYEAILDKKLDKRNFRRKLSLRSCVPHGNSDAGNFEKLKDKGNLFPF